MELDLSYRTTSNPAEAVLSACDPLEAFCLDGVNRDVEIFGFDPKVEVGQRALIGSGDFLGHEREALDRDPPHAASVEPSESPGGEVGLGQALGDAI